MDRNRQQRRWLCSRAQYGIVRNDCQCVSRDQNMRSGRQCRTDEGRMAVSVSTGYRQRMIAGLTSCRVSGDAP